MSLQTLIIAVSIGYLLGFFNGGGDSRTVFRAKQANEAFLCAFEEFLPGILALLFSCWGVFFRQNKVN